MWIFPLLHPPPTTSTPTKLSNYSGMHDTDEQITTLSHISLTHKPRQSTNTARLNWICFRAVGTRMRLELMVDGMSSVSDVTTWSTKKTLLKKVKFTAIEYHARKRYQSCRTIPIHENEGNACASLPCSNGDHNCTGISAPN